jgi:hypothetical protein
MPPPFTASTSTGPTPSENRYVFHLDDWDCKLSPDQATELARRIEDAIAGTAKREVRNHEDQTITVWRNKQRIALDFSSPHPDQYTIGTGDGLTRVEAKKLCRDLRAFADG